MIIIIIFVVRFSLAHLERGAHTIPRFVWIHNSNYIYKYYI